MSDEVTFLPLQEGQRVYVEVRVECALGPERVSVYMPGDRVGTTVPMSAVRIPEQSEDNEKAPANSEASSRSVSPGNPRPSEVDYSTSAGTIRRLEEENKALRRVIDGESGACRLCGYGPNEHGAGTVNSLHKFVQREGRADLALALSAAKTELAALKKRNGELYRRLNSAETKTEPREDEVSRG